ncbi:MAG TPA: alkylhydroperoxidase domain protein [Gryllotalpicola sp.]
MTDIITSDAIDSLLGADAATAVAALRNGRPVTLENAQASHAALFTADAAGASLVEKLAIAVFTAQLHGDDAAAEFYAGLLAEAGGEASVTEALRTAARAAAGTGPYGDFPSEELAAFNQDGPELAASPALVDAVGARLATALEHTHFLVFHPRDAVASRVAGLAQAGWSEDGIVTVSQLVAFLSFQLRVVAGLAVLAGAPRALAAPTDAVAPTRPRVSAAPEPGSEPGARPQRFTSAELSWVPWVEPVAADALSEEQRDALIDAARVKSPYFRLLSRDPGILKHRTLTDKDIFYNTKTGLPRAERELAAAATSRFNGCIYCASVHSRFAAHYSKRDADVQRLLDEGVAGEQEPRWRAIIDTAAALAQTPVAFDSANVAALQGAGLTDEEVYDVVHAAAFFNWANRLMLSLGEPELPAAV